MRLRGTFIDMLATIETSHAKAFAKGWRGSRPWYIEKANEIVNMQERELRFARAWPIPCTRGRKVARALLYLKRAQEMRDRIYAREPPVTAWSLVFGEYE